jgi:KUP system potassium uptake protein
VLLATAATVIASQALITGTYSLTLTAVQLGYLPRLSIRHTSEHARGQIYIPLVNWVLMLACLALVLAFRTSSNLAAAYGVAVTMTMLITTVLFYFAARHLWKWSLLKTLPLCVVFGLIEIAFLSANLVKFFDGGWFPLVVGAVIFIVMTTWATGRRLVRASMEKSSLTQEMLCESLKRRPPISVPGTAIFMTSTQGRAPIALLHSLKHYQAIHQRVIFMTLTTEDEPWVPPSRRVEVESLGEGFWRVTGRFGFMQKPNVPRLLRQCANSRPRSRSREGHLLPRSRNHHPQRDFGHGPLAQTPVLLRQQARPATRDVFPNPCWSSDRVGATSGDLIHHEHGIRDAQTSPRTGAGACGRPV